MLTRKELERRLALDPEGFIPPITQGEREALETALWLAERLEMTSMVDCRACPHGDIERGPGNVCTKPEPDHPCVVAEVEALEWLGGGEDDT